MDLVLSYNYTNCRDPFKLRVSITPYLVCDRKSGNDTRIYMEMLRRIIIDPHMTIWS